ncbi:sodium:solute symporter family protein [Halomonas marinisediminis]|uniref:Sodium:solute symporter family protein n=1 Tax=Halomonas marinisediminis TaxID=2546095 RepID=A0ABY2D9L1_9GAMM|nr:sodium:solute symporter family protein [Halomonas marinisediminis]TDB04724.1 sodium:solute symporter family protein [Halomonas marinisediminis]
MDSYKLFNWGLLFLTFGLMIYLGFLSSRIMKKDDEGGFLVAGRSLGAFVGASTIVATGFSGWGFMGSPGVTYQFGAIEVLGNFFFAPAMMIAVLYFARFLQRKAIDMGSNTIPEYIAQIHGGGTMGRLVQGVAALITILLLLVFLTSQIKAVGLLGASWLGIELTQSALLMVGVIILYTMLGGLAAVAWTDTVMVCGMSVAAVIIMVQIFTSIDLGSWEASLNAIDPELLNPTTGAHYGDSTATVFLVLPYAFLFAAVLPFMAIRFLAFKPDVKLHKAGVYVAILGALLSLVPLVGLYMRAQMPDLADPDNAMPAYLEHFMHPALQGFITLFILFAMKSTANSLLHTVASATSHDLRLALFNNLFHSQRLVLWVNRLAVVALGIVALLMMLYAPPFMLSWLGILGTGTLLASMIGPVFISTFWQGSAWGALVAMLAGFGTSGYMMLFADVGWLIGPLTGCVVSSICYVGVSLVTPRIRLSGSAARI